MYDIELLKEKEIEAKTFYKNHFCSFFHTFDYANLVGNIRSADLAEHSDIESLRYGSGFYLIFSDYEFQNNPCRLIIDGLKVIYRGHGVRIKKRVESHLFNRQYNLNKDRTTYSDCMKLDGNSGINIDDKPYSRAKWRVIYHPMINSSKTMREQAEQAFDEVYTQPFASKL